MSRRDNNLARSVALAFMTSAALPLFAFIPAVSHHPLVVGDEARLCVSAPLWENTASFDAPGRVTAATNALGLRVFNAKYDSVGSQKSAKPEVLPTGDRDFEAVRTHGVRNGIPRRNGNCNLLTATNALGLRVFNAKFDAVGNETWRIDGEGNTVTNTYDLADNLIRRLSQRRGDVEEEKFTYDLMGNLLTASNAVAREVFTHDVAEMPNLDKDDLSNYLGVLKYCQSDWENDDTHKLIIVFPASAGDTCIT
jgi:YD repeat-containing protein